MGKYLTFKRLTQHIQIPDVVKLFMEQQNFQNVGNVYVYFKLCIHESFPSVLELNLPEKERENEQN